MVSTTHSGNLYDNVNPQREEQHQPAKPNTEHKQGPRNKRRNWAEKLPNLLRKIGAVTVLISLYSFLSKGWVGSNDLAKYFMLLGNTTGLAVIALMIGHYFKEGKSPRLLLSLGLVSIPVNFAILGAFIFYGASDLVGANYPSYVAWKIDNLATALSTTLLALVVLCPIAYLGFRTLARGMSQRMTGYFLLSNVLLLVPFRDPFLVAGMAIVLGGLALMISTKTARQRIEAQTLEGRTALLIQFIPLAILLGRNLWLYAADEMVIWATSAMIFVAVRQAAYLSSRNMVMRYVLNSIALLSALSVGLFTWVLLSTMHASPSFSVMISVLTAAGLIYEISMREMSNRTLLRAIASLIASFGCIANLMVFGDMASSILTLVVGVGLLASCYLLQQRSLALTGTALMAAAIIDQGIRAFAWFDLGSWTVMLVLGVSAIVIASVLETQSGKVKYALQQHRKQLGEWCF